MVNLIPTISNKMTPKILWHMNDEKVYLTFDDGPKPEITPNILDLLKNLDIQATFFISGNKAKRYPKIVQQFKQNGHTIGNHSYSHSKVLWKSKEQIRFELKKTDDVLAKITGIKPTLFRPPHGLFGIQLLSVIKFTKHKIVLWSTSTLDYKPQVSAHDIQIKLTKCSRPGQIILLHDGHMNSGKTLCALENCLGKLKDNDIKFAALPDN